MLTKEDLINLIEKRLLGVYQSSLIGNLTVSEKTANGSIYFKCNVVPKYATGTEVVEGCYSTNTGFVVITDINNSRLVNDIFI